MSYLNIFFTLNGQNINIQANSNDLFAEVAMKYMTSAPGDRADIKKHAISYLIGAFIIFGVTGIIEFLIELSNVVDKHL